MGFPYVQEHGRFLPVISLQLKARGTKDWITFDAFVDSGASYSIFKTEIGDILGEKCLLRWVLKFALMKKRRLLSFIARKSKAAKRKNEMRRWKE